MSLKHNKKRNSGIVYELLVRNISDSLIKQDKKRMDESLSILRRFFSESSPIGQEHLLFEAVKKNRGVSRFVAEKTIEQMKKTFKGIDRKLLSSVKSNLIKEINYKFGKDFFNRFKLNDYKLLASISVVLESSQNINESVELLKFEEAIINYMITDSTNRVTVNKNHDALTYDIALKAFKGKYHNVLSKNQTTLLESFVYGQFSGQYKKFRELASADQKKLYKELVDYSKSEECKKDKVLLEKINESAQRLRNLNSDDETTVEELMLYHELSKEINSNE